MLRRRYILNKLITSREDILSISKIYIMENGFDSFNIRAIAKQCGISIGAVYNYFSSKSELIIATVESVWIEILEPLNRMKPFDNFVEAIQCMFETIETGNSKYPSFFSVHSLNFASEAKKEGIEMMNSYFSKLKQTFLFILEEDKNIRENIFNDILSAEKFIDYIFTLMISTLLNKEDSTSLLMFITNYIYESH